MSFFDLLGLDNFKDRILAKMNALSNTPVSNENQQKELLKDLNTKTAVRKISVKGVTFDNRQELLDRIVSKYGLEGVGKIIFIPEPDNLHDPDATKVYFENIGHLGYLPKEKASGINKLLAKNSYDIKWNIDYLSNKKSDVAYMEIRLYSKR